MTTTTTDAASASPTTLLHAHASRPGVGSQIAYTIALWPAILLALIGMLAVRVVRHATIARANRPHGARPLAWMRLTARS